MNTSLVNLNYRLDTIDFEFDDIEEFLYGEVKTLEKRFQMFNRKWYVPNSKSELTATKEIHVDVRQFIGRIHEPDEGR